MYLKWNWWWRGRLKDIRWKLKYKSLDFWVLLPICVYTLHDVSTRFDSSSSDIVSYKLSHSFRTSQYTWSVQKVSRILIFRGLRTFDFRFFVALCWYSLNSNLNIETKRILKQNKLDKFNKCFDQFGPSSIQCTY